MSKQKATANFFAGLEEVLARLVALGLNLLLFAVFTLASSDLQSDWLKLLQYLSIFWFGYEFLGLIFFEIFKFFANSRGFTNSADDTSDSTTVKAKNKSQQYKSQSGIEENTTTDDNDTPEKLNKSSSPKNDVLIP